MMKRLILILVALAAPLTASAQISSPETIKPGQAAHLVYEDATAGDMVRWEVLNPFPEPEINTIRTRYGVDLVVDPPCGWVGKIRVQCIVVGADERVKFIGTVVIDVKGEVVDTEPVDPEPKPPKPPEPEPKPEYNGQNDLGMGLISYENCPKYDRKFVVGICESAANYLRGYPTLKVIQANGSRRGTDYEVYVWLDKAMKGYPEYEDWYMKCMAYKAKMGVGVGSPVAMHIQMLNEMAAGIKGNE